MNNLISFIVNIPHSETGKKLRLEATLVSSILTNGVTGSATARRWGSDRFNSWPKPRHS